VAAGDAGVGRAERRRAQAAQSQDRMPPRRRCSTGEAAKAAWCCVSRPSLWPWRCCLGLRTRA